MKYLQKTCLIILTASIAACGGGSGSSTATNNSSNPSNNATLGYQIQKVYGSNYNPSNLDDFDFELSELYLRNSQGVSQARSILGKVTTNTKPSVEYIVTPTSVIYTTSSFNSKGEEVFSPNEKGSYENDVLTATYTDDPELVIKYTFGDLDISGKKISDVIDGGFVKNKFDAIPSTQNTFGTNESCKALTSVNFTKEHIWTSSVTATLKNQTKESFESYIANNLKEQSRSSTWQNIPWATDKYNSGYALINGDIWSITYESKGTEPFEPTYCDHLTKPQADFVVNAIKTVYSK